MQDRTSKKGKELFELFNERLSRGGKVESCDYLSLCYVDTLCMLRSMRSQDNCARIQPGFSFKDKKRDTEVGLSIFLFSFDDRFSFFLDQFH